MADKQARIGNTRTGHLTRAVNSLEDALAAEVLNKNEIEKYLGSVSLKLDKLQEESEKLVENLTEQEDIEKELDRMDGLQDKITDIQMRAKLVLEQVSKAPEIPQSPMQPPSLPKVFQTPKLPELSYQSRTWSAYSTVQPINGIKGKLMTESGHRLPFGFHLVSS